MALTRQQFSQIYRPAGPKEISVGNPAAPGAQINLGAGAIDLSIPIMGFRLRWRGRCVVGVAGFAAAAPIGFPAMIQNVRVSGINRRAAGNITLWDAGGSALYLLPQQFQRRAPFYSIDTGGAGRIQQAIATTPIPAAWNPVAVAATYDFDVILDVPFYPFSLPNWLRPGYLVRSDEWGDSLQLSVQIAAHAVGGATGPLGTTAAGTTLTWTAYGGAVGTPTLDIYSLPLAMGAQFQNSVLPGVCSRAASPITPRIIAAGNNVDLLDLQKQATTRLMMMVGTSGLAPFFLTLSDAVVTDVGIRIGGNRNVRNLEPIFVHKESMANHYACDFIPGVATLDFIQSGNTDSAYPGDGIGSGGTFQLIGNVAAGATNYGEVIQEQILYRPDGALYNAGS